MSNGLKLVYIIFIIFVPWTCKYTSVDRRAALELEKELKTAKSHALRMRCQLILLKADKRDSKEVGKIVICVQ